MDSAPVLLGIAGLLVGLGVLGIAESVTAMRSPFCTDRSSEIAVLGIGVIVTLLGAMMGAQTLASLQS